MTGHARLGATEGIHLQGGPDAVLLIHGLTGTPKEMRFVARRLNASGFTVSVPRLRGHCGTEAELIRTGWHDWYGGVEEALVSLHGVSRRVFVGGLSMGALLSLRLAHECRGLVSGVALYSPTLFYDGWSIPRLHFLLPLVLKTPFGRRYRFVESFPFGIKDARLRDIVVARMASGDADAAGFAATPGPSLAELRRLISHVKRDLPRITTPALILQARDDDMTSPRNAAYLARRLAGPVRQVLLDDCYHMITIDKQREEVARQTASFFSALPLPAAAASPIAGLALGSAA
ncbi:alpha/beta hydrolase [Vineibacter terrae]|uniref:alpha/beta hydrolase n=1 Tax=Vineibacter terrae TaxID=2586908 RepID=UPI002E2EF72A|nr:alpha/beta fold hydrolase [Vineibacter terrae]HEX2887069.1 alpha/beta fold hydrolase [Vineibacter terrae]